MKSLHDLIPHHLLDHHAPGCHGDGHECSGASTVVSGAVMAVGNYVLYSLAMVVLARHVYSTHTFGDISAAIAAVTVGATAGTLGLEKYLLKLVPACRAQGSVELIRGFRRFAPVVVMAVSCIVACALVLVWALSEADSALHHRSFLVGICVLPLVVFVAYFLEVATADGAYLSATFIYRILFPGLFLIGVYVLDAVRSPIVADHAVIMWGICWAIVLALLIVVVIRTVPFDERRGERRFQRLTWIRHSSAYLTYSLLLSLMANTGVLVLGFVSAEKQQTAVYAVVAQLGALFVVISTAVNRWYGPQISAIIATQDADRGQVLMSSRRRIMWVIALLYVLAIVFLGKPVLGLFGEDYVVGYVPLLIIGGGTVVTSMNSLAPIYIQYSGREWTVPIMLGSGVALAFALTVPLASIWGVEGAAIGYAAAASLLFMAFHLYAHRLRRKKLQALGRSDLTPRI